MNVTIRDANESDVDGILEIFNDVIIHSTAVYSLEPVSRTNRLNWLRERKADQFPVLVAVASTGEVLGFASYGHWRGSWPGYRFTVEHSVHVHRQHRGQAIGRQLMEALIQRAVAAEIHVMVGGVDGSNEASIRFHQQLGFESVAHFREVGRKFDRWLDLVFLQKILDDRPR